MSNRIVGQELIEVDVDPTQVHLYLRVEAEQWSPTTEVRAYLSGPINVLKPTEPGTFPFKALPNPEEDVDEGVNSFEVLLDNPALWSPESPYRYEGQVELWEGGVRVDAVPLHYAVYMLGWDEDALFVNEEPLIPRLREVQSLDEVTARRLRKEGVNVVLLPATDTAAWEIADQVGLFLLGELPADGALPEDLLDRSVRPCCLGWVYPSLETPMPDEPIPGLFGLRSDLPYEELPEEVEFLLLDAPPDLAPNQGLGYPWIVRQK